MTSTPQLESDTYGAGETIQFTVTFNVAVDVDGDPVLKFVLGNSGDTREVDAAYVSGTGAKALVFGYTVVSTDEDDNGIYLRDEQDYDDPDGPVRLDSNDEIEFKVTSQAGQVPLYWQGRFREPLGRRAWTATSRRRRTRTRRRSPAITGVRPGGDTRRWRARSPRAEDFAHTGTAASRATTITGLTADQTFFSIRGDLGGAGLRRGPETDERLVGRLRTR